MLEKNELEILNLYRLIIRLRKSAYTGMCKNQVIMWFYPKEYSVIMEIVYTCDPQ